MKISFIFLQLLSFSLMYSCTTKELNPPQALPKKQVKQIAYSPGLTIDQANRLAPLPMTCLHQQYPNKLGQVLGGKAELLSPRELHPIFYGCFDWHSSVHGHWLLVALLNKFENLENRDSIIRLLDHQFTPEKVHQEIAFFKTKFNTSFERTYGWAWLLKLHQELVTWENPKAKKWAKALQPLTDLVVKNYTDFLPKLQHPIRSGEHTNTAFALSFAYDYAETVQDSSFHKLIERSAYRYYYRDVDYKLSFEPSGYDFLSPAFQEIDIMRKVLPQPSFENWLANFLPELAREDFNLESQNVRDRNDGKLVHLEGLNFSRAWCLFDLAQSNKKYEHLQLIGKKHLDRSLPTIMDGQYMGEHWLASFAVYALMKNNFE